MERQFLVNQRQQEFVLRQWSGRPWAVFNAASVASALEGIDLQQCDERGELRRWSLWLCGRAWYRAPMRYLVKARVKPGKEEALLRAIEDGTLGCGSVAGDEYLWNMQQARRAHDGTAHWVEVCFCGTPQEEERPYWEEYFDFVSVRDAHARKNCRDSNGTEPWACSDCDCTHRLEEKLQRTGESFLMSLKQSQ